MLRMLILSSLLLTTLAASTVSAQTTPSSYHDEPSIVLPGGILAAGDCFSAALSAANEVPPTTSTATGTATFVLAPDMTSLVYHIEYGSMSAAETVAHIHKAAPGTNGAVVFPLSVGSPKDGVLTLSTAQVEDLRSGLYYVNIHSSLNPAGEIRGQVVPAGGCYSARIDGAQEVPPTSSTATGSGVFALSADGTDLVYSIVFSGLSAAETVQHIHKAAPGVSGGVVFPLPAGSPKNGTLALTDAQRSDFLNGLYYINIHSTAFPAGEIRGQILPSSTCYSSTLSGANEVPANTSTTTGQGRFVLSSAGKLSYQITFNGLTAPETVQHIHKAAPGMSGGVVFPLPAGSPKIGTLTLSDAQLADLRAGLYYVNIHSGAFPAGEIRGQIVQAACTTHLPLIQN